MDMVLDAADPNDGTPEALAHFAQVGMSCCRRARSWNVGWQCLVEKIGCTRTAEND